MHVELPGLAADAFADIVGEECYEQALRYVRDKAVVQQVWVAEQNALCGVVRGRHGGFYTPAVYFTAGARARVSGAQCSCTARYGCEHAAALLLAATREQELAYGQGPMPEQGPAHTPGPVHGPGAAHTPGAARSQGPAWERSLEELLLPAADGAIGNGAIGNGHDGAMPLAIELSLVPDAHRSAPPRLMARLVHPGKNGGWIYGSLSWTKLDNYDYHGGYRRSHVRLLREMMALHRNRVNQSYYYYSYGDDRHIELSAFESPRLWPLLDEARDAGLRLLRATGREPMDHYRQAELCLDVTGRDSLTIAPVIRLTGNDRPMAAIRFIGADGHGVVYADGAGRFHLARLSRPAPESLQRLALGGDHLEVPDAEAFRTRYYPRLRRTATLISSDGSFVPPEISEPTLVIQASYGDGHELEVGWEWLYQVGGTEVRLPLNDGQQVNDGQQSWQGQQGQHGSDYRDPAAERAVLESLPSGPRLGTISGLDTMRFTVELLPLLRGQPGVAVEVSGTPADYREATARIGVSADERAGETDWFDLGVTITVEDREVPFAEVFKALSRGETHLLLADGAYFSLEKPELQALKSLIEEARALQDSGDGPLKISRFQVSLWDELAALGVVSRQARAWSEGVLSLRNAPGNEKAAPPPTINAQLRPYQLDGFQWLAFLWQHRLGGILADDMGLGKTLQTLTLIRYAKDQERIAPFIIVAPTSVVPNWATEAAKFAPDLTVRTITSRAQRIGELARGADAIVTSYTLLRLDFEDYADVEWSGLILDEAQAVKNHQSQIYQCTRKLPAPFKIAITGTPMENNVMELWSLLSITAPGLFPNPARFKEYYVQPIEKKGDAELLAQLRRRIRPLIMRRTKEQVASDLPPKQEQILEVELHPKHRKIYQTHLQRERQKVLGLLGDMNANRFTILRSLTLLRQLSLHPALVDTVHGDVPSAKIDTLIDQIRDVVGGGHRALVFSQFTSFLTYVRIRLAAAGIEYCYLDGSTRDRTGVLSEFKDGAAPVFLISLKAGGFGLNLTEADYCFLLDPWWNPATEAQAVDRTHRIGQTRTVMVYRLIAKDTIEEKVMALQARKAELFASVMDEGNTFGTRLTAEDIQGLFS